MYIIILKNILKVSTSNIIKLLSGVLVGFLLPKIIGITDYGYYKVFTLYGTYIGLFAFGITDGVHLKYGGVDYDAIDRYNFRAYSTFYIVIEAFLSIIGIVASCVFLNSDYKFIFIALSLFLFTSNISGYYQIISQITGRFNEFTFRTILQSVLILLSIVFLGAAKYIFNVDISYQLYTMLYVAIIAVLAIWYIYTYREITFGSKAGLKECRKDILKFVKLGVPLLVANLCSTFILTIDRQFVNILFDTKTYAIYAFAYNMLSLITTALAAISTVIYPVMKRMSIGSLIINYNRFIETIFILVFGSLAIYYPLCLFIKWFLPDYADSLYIFRIILPGVSVSSSITLIHNYYKTLEIERRFFAKSIIILLLSAFANYIAYKLFRTTASISIASIIIMVSWYIITDFYFIRKYNIKTNKSFIYLIIMILLFYLVTIVENMALSFSLYMVAYLTFTFLMFRKDLKSIFAMIMSDTEKH